MHRNAHHKQLELPSEPNSARDDAPDRQPDDTLDRDVACPFCRSREVELISLFGGQLSTDQYYCRACRTYFERFGRDDARPTL